MMIIFHRPAPATGQRVENGITGTITDTSREEHENRVTIKTRENPPREVDVDTSEFHELSLGYASRSIASGSRPSWPRSSRERYISVWSLARLRET
jgi:hypothetical protein